LNEKQGLQAWLPMLKGTSLLGQQGDCQIWKNNGRGGFLVLFILFLFYFIYFIVEELTMS